VSDAIELLPWLSGPGAIVLWNAGKWAATRFVKKVDNAEEKAADLAAKQLQEVLETTKRVERAVDSLTHTVTTQGGTLTAVQNRVEGISENYGKRIHVLEETAARHDERLKVVERVRGKR
jgi:flagellin-like hook-associated protein FlgL